MSQHKIFWNGEAVVVDVTRNPSALSISEMLVLHGMAYPDGQPVDVSFMEAADFERLKAIIYEQLKGKL